MLDTLWAVAGFIVAIGVLVSFHEFGHFWVARRLGVRVLRFSLGFGKPIWTRRGADGVEYTLSVLPLGGYVKMLDEREGPVAPTELAQAFNRQTVGRRALIVVAGPAFNFMLAVVAYWIVFISGVTGPKPLIAEPPSQSRAAAAQLHAGETVLTVNQKPVQTWQDLHTRLIEFSLESSTLDLKVRGQDGEEREIQIPLAGVRVDPEFLFADLGLKPYQPPIPALLEEVIPDDPAHRAGLRAGDRLLSYDGIAITSWQQWAEWLRAHPGQVVLLEFQRGDATMRREVILARDAGSGQGRFGARVKFPEELISRLNTTVRLGPLDAFVAAGAQTWRMSVLTLKMLGRMVVGDISIKNVSGPIQIAQIAGYSAQLGIVTFLSFMAIISISLGVLNLLPIPVLDGGHLLYYVAEALKGSPLTERVQALGQQIGMGLLFALMGLAFYNDFHRLIG